MHTHVTIIGAGLGGLVLARMLAVQDIPVTVYEAEPSPTSRAQGGMLDIHAENGQPALEAAGLIEEFRALVLEGRESMRILDRDGAVLYDEPAEGSTEHADRGRPEVQRADLRRLLLDSLPEGTVRWGYKATGVRAWGEGRHEVAFADGGTVTTSLLVGADGAWSRVRPLLSDAVPTYSGTTFVETWLVDGDTRHPAAAKAVGAGSLLATAPGQGIAAHREAGGTLHAYVSLTRPQDWFADIDVTDIAGSTERVAQEFAGWAPELTALITETDVVPVLRPLHTLPIGHRWDRVPGVTLVGDAAHLAPPNGEGANLALQDGAELGRLLATHAGNPEAALAEYEQGLFPRGAAAAADGSELHELMFDDSAPHGLVAAFTAFAG